MLKHPIFVMFLLSISVISLGCGADQDFEEGWLEPGLEALSGDGPAAVNPAAPGEDEPGLEADGALRTGTLEQAGAPGPATPGAPSGTGQVLGWEDMPPRPEEPRTGEPHIEAEEDASLRLEGDAPLEAEASRSGHGPRAPLEHHILDWEDMPVGGIGRGDP